MGSCLDDDIRCFSHSAAAEHLSQCLAPVKSYYNK
jgi:hypothetical protein